MNKLIKKGDIVIVQLEDGRTFSKAEITDLEFLSISQNLENEEWLLRFFIPDYDKYLSKKEEYHNLRNDIDAVPFLSLKKDNSVYWEEISSLSLPPDFAKAIVKAFNAGNEKALNAYKNFWILLSLNPNEECRKNLWWFLNYHGLTISSSGFFVAYRNAIRTNKKNEEGEYIYTDDFSRTTSISIGHSVSISRDKCDFDNNRECSKGLHAASVNWLKHNYFGDQGFVVLVNPYNVVAVPHNSEYGKLRCCEYLPIDYATYDNEGNLIPYNVEMGFECPYAAQAIYEGIVAIEKNKYVIKMPEELNIVNKDIISNNLLNLAKECITNRDYNIK